MAVFETERLVIAKFTLDDAPFVFELVNDPAWIKFIGDRGVHSLEDARDFIANRLQASYETFGFGLYLVALKETAVSIGMCGLVKRDFLEDVDIGFAFLPDYRGQGFAYEAASAVMSYAKDTLGIGRVVAITDTNNIRSMHLLGKLGLHLEGTITFPDDDTAVNLFVPQQ